MEVKLRRSPSFGSSVMGLVRGRESIRALFFLLFPFFFFYLLFSLLLVSIEMSSYKEEEVLSKNLLESNAKSHESYMIVYIYIYMYSLSGHVIKYIRKGRKKYFLSSPHLSLSFTLSSFSFSFFLFPSIAFSHTQASF